MTIDDTTDDWTGTEFADVVTYLEELEPGGYPVNRVVEARCACEGRTFRVTTNSDELARTECTLCGAFTFVADADEYWDDADVHSLTCRCGGGVYEVGLGLRIREDGFVRWGSLGTRCVACGLLSCPIDWKWDLNLPDPRAVRVASGTPLISWEGEDDD